MLQLHSTSEQDQVVETMIALTHLSNLNRAIVAGQGSTDLYLALRRRGLARIGFPSRFACARGRAPSVSSPSRIRLPNLRSHWRRSPLRLAPPRPSPFSSSRAKAA